MARIAIENVNHPGSVEHVDADKCAAMKRAYLAVLLKSTPGLTAAEIKERLLAKLPQDLFPGGTKAGWWAKAVQLDLEAKGVIARTPSRPIRFHRT
jgi:hypothetical protein